MDSLDGSYLACDTRIADAKPFDPIRFKYERADKVAACLTGPQARPLRPALDHATKIIEGFETPYGLELLATVDWLNRREQVALDQIAMVQALPNWPGPAGSAERKASVFGAREIGIAVDHLQRLENMP